MRFLLDTNAVIALLGGKASVIARVKQHHTGDFGVPSVVMHELFFGAFRSARTTVNVARIDALHFAVLDFDREDARRAGEVRAHLAGAGAPIGPYDALIAGQALARDLVLVTHNTREFGRVPGLRLEDWE